LANINGHIIREKIAFTAYLDFHSRAFPETLQLVKYYHCPQKVSVWLLQANNEGLFTCNIKYNHGSFKDFISAIFLKHRTWHTRHIV